MVGEATRFGYDRRHGALEGRRILLTCSGDIRANAAHAIHDLGGIPLQLRQPHPMAQPADEKLPAFDVIIFAGGPAVETFVGQWGRDSLQDKIIVAINPPTATAVEQLGFTVDVISPTTTLSAGIEAIAWAFVQKWLMALTCVE